MGKEKKSRLECAHIYVVTGKASNSFFSALMKHAEFQTELRVAQELGDRQFKER